MHRNWAAVGRMGPAGMAGCGGAAQACRGCLGGVLLVGEGAQPAILVCAARGEAALAAGLFLATGRRAE
ncbi:hypothetical protein BDZ91DRAFT_715699 [Kalaharituber pfeilii]|nr:hypothetical protein BDZ91DRAFT_715699 [Kalaharituber pfeilii]